LLEKFPKSQVDSQNHKIWRWGKIPSSGGLEALSKSKAIKAPLAFAEEGSPDIG